MATNQPLIRALPGLLKKTFTAWNADNAPRLGAALAYYTVFSIAPLLAIVISIAGIFFGYEAVQGRLFGEISSLVGPEGAQTIQSMIASARKPTNSILTTIIGVVILLLGASGVFGELKGALNVIWNVEPQKTGGILSFMKARFLSFSMVLGVGFLFLVSLIISTVLSALQSSYKNLIPGPDIVASIVNFAVSFGVITLLLAMLFRYLPDAKVPWRNVWVGAIGTAFLFTIGKFLIGVYLGRVATSSSYGAAGSVVIILLWVYYSAQIFLFGAEFTRVYSEWIKGLLADGERAPRKTDRLSYA